MSFGSTADTLMYELVFVLAAIPAAILLVALGNLIQRLAGVQSAWLGFGIMFLPLVSVLVGTSLYLDQAGVVMPAQVSKKTETIKFREQGDWEHAYEIEVRYTTSTGESPAAHFGTTAALYDRLHEGDSTAVRSVSVNGWFNLVRLADQSTWTWIPWRWLVIGLAVIALAWVGWHFLRNKTGGRILLGIALILFVIPFVLKFNEWQHSENPALTPLRATGVITEVRRVTEIDPLPGDNRSSSSEWETEVEVAQQYDIVVVRYTPQGHTDAVLGVDAIDASSQSVEPDQPVEIAYAATDPRDVRLPSATRSHYWKNPVEWLKQQTLALLVVLGFVAGSYAVNRWWQRLLASRQQPGQTG